MSIDLLLSELNKVSPEMQIELIEDFKKKNSTEQIKLLRERLKTQPWLYNILKLCGLDVVSEVALDEKVNFSEVYKETIDNIEEIKSKAIADNLGFIIHELDPIIGSLEVSAATEIANYDKSKVAAEIECLKGLVDMFEAWKKAESPPYFKNINIFERVDSEIKRFGSQNEKYFLNQIKSDLVFEVDSTLFRTIISNALRNALESNMQVNDRNPLKIIVNGGISDTYLWVSIIDDGVGLPDTQANLAKVNYSTKAKGRGFGLSIVLKSINAMKGRMNLEKSNPHGACFYFEIPQRNNEL